MPLEVPKTDKTYTTVYENFKGVDYTNDATNVYKRRSPSGLNMMPNLDGKPYKRKGWQTEYSSKKFAEVYSEATSTSYEGEVNINKLEYFEIAGLDHVAVFTDIALFMLRATENGEELVLISSENDVKDSYERTFFFEGNGTAAFYIYGNYKIWSYKYNDETEAFAFGLEDPYVPAIRISTSADGSTAVAHEGVNMVGKLVAEEFQNNAVPYVVTGSMVGVSEIEEKLFLNSYSEAREHVFTLSNSRWKDDSGIFVEMSTIGITPASGVTTIKVTVRNELLVYLFNKINDYINVSVKVSDEKYSSEKFGRQLTYVSLEPSEGEFSIETRTTETEEETIEKTVIKFHDLYVPLVDGEDAIRVEYSTNKATGTSHSVDFATYGWG